MSGSKKGADFRPPLHSKSFFAAVPVAKNTFHPASVPMGRAQQGEKGVYGGKPVPPRTNFTHQCCG